MKISLPRGLTIRHAAPDLPGRQLQLFDDIPPDPQGGDEWERVTAAQVKAGQKSPGPSPKFSLYEKLMLVSMLLELLMLAWISWRA